MDAVMFELNRNRLASIIIDSWRIDYEYVQSGDGDEGFPTRIDDSMTSSPDSPLQAIYFAYMKILERDLVGFSCLARKQATKS